MKLIGYINNPQLKGLQEDGECKIFKTKDNCIEAGVYVKDEHPLEDVAEIEDVYSLVEKEATLNALINITQSYELELFNRGEKPEDYQHYSEATRLIETYRKSVRT